MEIEEEEKVNKELLESLKLVKDFSSETNIWKLKKIA